MACYEKIKPMFKYGNAFANKSEQGAETDKILI